MSAGKVDDYTAGMIVQLGLLVSPVVDIDHHYVLVFEMQLVVLGLRLGGILRDAYVRRQTHNCGCTEKSAQHGSASRINQVLLELWSRMSLRTKLTLLLLPWPVND